MDTLKTSIVVCLCIVVVQSRSLPMNAVEDAHLQASNLLRCWEPVNGSPEEHQLSDPKYEYCSYSPSANWEKAYVNGVEEGSDDYTQINKIFADVMDNYAVLNVCLQEAFALSKTGQTMIRCLCKRDACNIPSSMAAFFDHNKQVIPQPQM